MSKNDNQNQYEYVMFQTLRRGKNNNGVCLQLTPTKKGILLLTLANQSGVQNGLPKFDYTNALKTGFSDLEAAEIALMLERQLMSGGFEAKLTYPHLNAEVPKNIQFAFSVREGKVQCALGIYPQNPNVAKAMIYLNEAEMNVLKVNFQKQISLYDKKNMIELFDTKMFKEYMAGGK